MTRGEQLIEGATRIVLIADGLDMAQRIDRRPAPDIASGPPEEGDLYIVLSDALARSIARHLRACAVVMATAGQ